MAASVVLVPFVFAFGLASCKGRAGSVSLCRGHQGRCCPAFVPSMARPPHMLAYVLYMRLGTSLLRALVPHLPVRLLHALQTCSCQLLLTEGFVTAMRPQFVTNCHPSGLRLLVAARLAALVLQVLKELRWMCQACVLLSEKTEGKGGQPSGWLHGVTGSTSLLQQGGNNNELVPRAD